MKNGYCPEMNLSNTLIKQYFKVKYSIKHKYKQKYSLCILTKTSFSIMLIGWKKQLFTSKMCQLYKQYLQGTEQITIGIDPFPNKLWFFTCLQYKSFENTAGRGEVARYEQFLLFPKCFLPVWEAFCHFQ